MAPDTIILDTRAFLQQVAQVLAQSQQREIYAENIFYFLTDLMTDLVNRLSQKVYAAQLLHDLVVDIAGGIYPSGAGMVDPALAGPVAALGNYLLEEFHEKGFYDSSGRLPYHLHVMTRMEDNVNMVLRRNNGAPL